MSLGKKIFEIDYTNWAKGMSSSDDIPDAGFSPSTDAVNLIAVPGIMYQPTQPTDKSTGMLGDNIASCEDPAGSAYRLYVSSDTDQDGRFYSIDVNGTLTQRGSEDTGANYIQGRTDMIGYKGEVYVTNNNYIVRWQQPATFNLTFFTFNDTVAPHPALVYEDNAFYGDGNRLLRQDSAGGAPATIMTLPSNYIIIALGTDPGSGKILISTVGQYNTNGVVNSQPRVLYYNGFGDKAQKEVPVDEMITAFPYTEGQVYAAYGKNLGLWNGAGVTFLRTFNIAYDNTELMYKHHFTSIASTLYFIEKTKIIAHGPVRQGGEKVFYPAYKNNVNSNNFTNVVNIGQGVLSLSFGTEKFYTWSTTSVATSNTQLFLSNVVDFDNEYWLRWVRIIYKNTVSNNVDPGSIRFLNENGTVQDVAQSGLFDLRNTSGASSAYKDILNINIRLKQVQTNLLLDTVNPGIRRIIGYGEIANQPN